MEEETTNPISLSTCVRYFQLFTKYDNITETKLGVIRDLINANKIKNEYADIVKMPRFFHNNDTDVITHCMWLMESDDQIVRLFLYMSYRDMHLFLTALACRGNLTLFAWCFCRFQNLQNASLSPNQISQLINATLLSGSIPLFDFVCQRYPTDKNRSCSILYYISSNDQLTDKLCNSQYWQPDRHIDMFLKSLKFMEPRKDLMNYIIKYYFHKQALAKCLLFFTTNSEAQLVGSLFESCCKQKIWWAVEQLITNKHFMNQIVSNGHESMHKYIELCIDRDAIKFIDSFVALHFQTYRYDHLPCSLIRKALLIDDVSALKWCLDSFDQNDWEYVLSSTNQINQNQIDLIMEKFPEMKNKIQFFRFQSPYPMPLNKKQKIFTSCFQNIHDLNINDVLQHVIAPTTLFNHHSTPLLQLLNLPILSKIHHSSPRPFNVSILSRLFDWGIFDPDFIQKWFLSTMTTEHQLDITLQKCQDLCFRFNWKLVLIIAASVFPINHLITLISFVQQHNSDAHLTSRYFPWLKMIVSAWSHNQINTANMLINYRCYGHNVKEEKVMITTPEYIFHGVFISGNLELVKQMCLTNCRYAHLLPPTGQTLKSFYPNTQKINSKCILNVTDMLNIFAQFHIQDDIFLISVINEFFAKDDIFSMTIWLKTCLQFQFSTLSDWLCNQFIQLFGIQSTTSAFWFSLFLCAQEQLNNQQWMIDKQWMMVAYDLQQKIPSFRQIPGFCHPTFKQQSELALNLKLQWITPYHNQEDDDNIQPFLNFAREYFKHENFKRIDKSLNHVKKFILCKDCINLHQQRFFVQHCAHLCLKNIIQSRMTNLICNVISFQ